MAYYVKSETRNGNTTEFSLNDLSESEIYLSKFDLLSDCVEGFDKVEGKENAYSNGEIEIVIGEVLSSEEIQDLLLEIGETGNYKVDRNSLYTKREENADWLYCGEVINRNQVDEIFETCK